MNFCSYELELKQKKKLAGEIDLEDCPWPAGTVSTRQLVLAEEKKKKTWRKQVTKDIS